MPRDYYPRRESDILTFTANFSARLSADPERYRIPPEQASAYAQLVSDFSQAYSLCNNNGGNCTANFAVKESARVALEKGTRPIVAMIKGQGTVTDAMRIELGIPARPLRRNHIAPPETAPLVWVQDWSGRSLTVRLSDSGSMRAAKPRDISGAVIVAYVGENPPSRMDRWSFKASPSRAVTELRFDSAPPGSKVWIAAYWHNPRLERGPWSKAVSTYVPLDGIAHSRELRRAA